jgi:rhodanese-related sulfurtransferase
MTPQELKQIIYSNQSPGVDYLIIDVRGDDFEVGNIVDCKNIPAQEFLDTVMEQIEFLKDIPTLIFHCALSQVRGPKCFQRYKNHQKTNHQKLYILQGGFCAFGELYKNDARLVENYNQDYWDNQ